jgi:hypothetical protein
LFTLSAEKRPQNAVEKNQGKEKNKRKGLGEGREKIEDADHS